MAREAQIVTAEQAANDPLVVAFGRLLGTAAAEARTGIARFTCGPTTGSRTRRDTGRATATGSRQARRD